MRRPAAPRPPCARPPRSPPRAPAPRSCAMPRSAPRRVPGRTRAPALRSAALGADARQQEDRPRHGSRRPASMSAPWRHDRADVREAASRRRPRPAGRRAARAVSAGAARRRRVLDLGRAGVGRADQHERARASRSRRRDERLERVPAQHRVQRDGVHPEPATSPHGVGVYRAGPGRSRRGVGHVAALSVGDHEQAGLAPRLATSASAAQPGAPSRSKQASCSLTAAHAGAAASITARQWRRPRRPRAPRAIRRRRARAPRQQPRRVRVEAEHDLAALGRPPPGGRRSSTSSSRGRPPTAAPQRAKRDGLGGPSPLTACLSSEPAVKRGTLPPGIVIRSLVCGLTPWRGPRSATWNLPKPVSDVAAGAERVVISRTPPRRPPCVLLRETGLTRDPVDELLLRQASPFVGGRKSRATLTMRRRTSEARSAAL